MAQAAGALTSGLCVEHLQTDGGMFPQLSDLEAYQCAQIRCFVVRASCPTRVSQVRLCCIRRHRSSPRHHLLLHDKILRSSVQAPFHRRLGSHLHSAHQEQHCYVLCSRHQLRLAPSRVQSCCRQAVCNVHNRRICRCFCNADLDRLLVPDNMGGTSLCA